MKTIYLIKSFLPFIFLPIAPGVVQVELVRQGLLSNNGVSVFLTILVQVAFTLGMFACIAKSIKPKNQSKAFLRMSAISKKVFHKGEWVSVEQYLADSHNVVVSHSMTPEEAKVWVYESEQWLREEKDIEAVEKAEAGVS